MHVWSKPRRAQALLASVALLAVAVPLAGGARPAAAAVGTGAPNQFLIVTPNVNVSGGAGGSGITVSGCGFVSGGSVTVGIIPVASASILTGPQNPQTLVASPSGCINGTYNVPSGTPGNSYFVEAYDNQQTLYGAVANNTFNLPYGTSNKSLNLSANGGTYSGSSIVLPLSQSGTTVNIINASGFAANANADLTAYLTSTSNPSTLATVEVAQTGTYATDGNGVVESPIPFDIQPSVAPGTYFIVLTDGQQYDIGEVQITGTTTGGGTGTGGITFPTTVVAGQPVTATACGFSSLNAAQAAVVSYYTFPGGALVGSLTTSVANTAPGAGCYSFTFTLPTPGSFTVTITGGLTQDVQGVTVVAPTTPTPVVTPSPTATPAGNTGLTFSPSSAQSGTSVTASGCNFSAVDAAANNFTLNIGGVLVKPTAVFGNLGLGSTCYSFSFTVPQVTAGTYSVSAAGPNSTATDFGSFTVAGSTCNPYYGCNCNTYYGCCTSTSSYGCCATTSSYGCNCNTSYGCCTTSYGCNTCTTYGCNVCTYSCYPGNNGGLIIGTSATLTVSPSSVVAGGSATITGSGFYPGASVTLSSSGIGLATTVLDPYGTFTYTVTPLSTTTSGTYTITATDSTGRTASTTLVVSGSHSATLAASATSGSVGQQITVTGTGFAAYEQFTLYLNTPGTTPAIAGTVQIYNADANGNFTVTYSVPSVVSGTYYLSALGQSSRINPYISFTVLNGLYQVGGSSSVQPVQTVQSVQVQPVTQVVQVQPVQTSQTVQVTNVSPSATLASVSTAATTTYFADGYTGTASSNGKATFTVKLYLFNPSNATSSVTTSYAVLDASSNSRTLDSVTDSVPAGATLVRSVNTDVGNNKQVSTMVKATGGIVAEEVITRVGADGSTLDAASTLGSSHLSTNWYFAEGYTGQSLQEYITLYNPSGTAANAQIKYMPMDGNVPAAQSVSVPANGQVTVNVRAQYNLLNPTGSKSIGAQVTSDQPIAVDRAMYWGDGDGSGKYGYSLGSGISTPAATQYFAFLPTSDGSQSFVTVLNPGGSSTNVTLNLLDQSGNTVKSVSASVNANARYTFVVPSIVAGAGAISGGLVSSQTPVVAEAGLYFGGSPNIGRHPGIVVQGSNGSQVGARADVYSGGGELHIFNPGTTSIRVQVQLSTTSGATTVLDATLAGQATKVLTLQSGTDPQSVVVRGSGFFTAVLVNGGVGNSQAWGGNLN